MKPATVKAALPKATAARRAGGAPDAGYLRLIRRFPLRPIRAGRDYDAAAATLDSLVLREDLSPGEVDYLEVLTGLVEAYDREHHAPPVDVRTPLQRLKATMDGAGVTPAELRSILGLSQPAVSLILSGKRQLSKQSILALAQRFSLDPSYFLLTPADDC